MPFFIRKKSNRLTSSFATESTSSSKRPRNGLSKSKPPHKNVKKGQQGRRGGGPGTKRLSDNEIKRLAQKRVKIDKNEEIESSESESESDLEMDRPGKLDQAQKGQDQDYSDDDGVHETAQEKKLRLAKIYLEEIAREERERREKNDVDNDEEFANNLDDLVGQRLHDDVLEQEGRLRKEIACRLEPDLSSMLTLTSSKYLKRSVTCLCISPDDQFIYSGSKDCILIKWSVADGVKVGMVKKKEILSKRKKRREESLKKKKGSAAASSKDDPNLVHSSTITAIAISSDGKFLATGDEDHKIAIWNPENLQKIHIFAGHRGAIRGLAFRKKTHTLYSASDDKSVRIWSLDEMSYVETLFGHQDAVTCIDALTRERCITGGGRDNTIRVWKIVEESQLIYNGHYNGSIDSIKLINEESFVSTGDDGSISTWNVNRKKPIFTLNQVHGLQEQEQHSSTSTIGETEPKEDNLNSNNNQSQLPPPPPRWISALSTLPNTDLFASGSSDGFIRFWKCGERFKSLDPVYQVPCQGWINCLEFSHNIVGAGSAVSKGFIIAGIGKEHRLGRWFENIKDVKQSIVIIPLVPNTSTVEKT